MCEKMKHNEWKVNYTCQATAFKRKQGPGQLITSTTTNYCKLTISAILYFFLAILTPALNTLQGVTSVEKINSTSHTTFKMATLY